MTRTNCKRFVNMSSPLWGYANIITIRYKSNNKKRKGLSLGTRVIITEGIEWKLPIHCIYANCSISRRQGFIHILLTIICFHSTIDSICGILAEKRSLRQHARSVCVRDPFCTPAGHRVVYFGEGNARFRTVGYY